MSKTNATYWHNSGPPISPPEHLAALARRNLWQEFLETAHPDYRRLHYAAMATRDYVKRKQLFAERDAVLAGLTPPIDWDNVPAPSGCAESPHQAFMSGPYLERWAKNRKGHPGEKQD
jgi:hypothetical protein